MKRFTKTMLIAAAVLAVTGVICIAVAFRFGLTPGYLIHMIRNGRFSFGPEDFHITYEDPDATDSQDAVNDSQNAVDDSQDAENDSQDTENNSQLAGTDQMLYEVADYFHSMDIEFGAGVLEIRYADVDQVQVKVTNIENLTVDVKQEVLRIREKANLHLGIDDFSDRCLQVLIPRDMDFEEIELEIGASKAEISDLKGKEMHISVGAGKADMTDLSAKQFDLEVGAGEANVNGLSAEEIEVEAGVGKVEVTLTGSQKDYNYNVECGIGRVVVGSHAYSGLGAEESVRSDDATKEIGIECGIGEVIIRFKDKL